MAETVTNRTKRNLRFPFSREMAHDFVIYNTFQYCGQANRDTSDFVFSSYTIGGTLQLEWSSFLKMMYMCMYAHMQYIIYWLVMFQLVVPTIPPEAASSNDIISHVSTKYFLHSSYNEILALQEERWSYHYYTTSSTSPASANRTKRIFRFHVCRSGKKLKTHQACSW